MHGHKNVKYNVQASCITLFVSAYI